MSTQRLFIGVAILIPCLAWGQVGPITAADPGFPITSEFGPRMLSGVPDFHPGIDYGATAGTAAPLIEAGTISRLSFDGGGLSPTAGTILFFEFDTATSHHFRYLHMFNNTALPINSGGFTLTLTSGGHLAIVHWVGGQVGSAADYALSPSANENPQIGGVNVKDSQGVDILTTNIAQSPVGPVGYSGLANPNQKHLHIDLGAGISQNPLEYIAHAASNFTVQFLDSNGAPRQNGFVVNPNDPASSFINVHLDNEVGN